MSPIARPDARSRWTQPAASEPSYADRINHIIEQTKDDVRNDKRTGLAVVNKDERHVKAHRDAALAALNGTVPVPASRTSNLPLSLRTGVGNRHTTPAYVSTAWEDQTMYVNPATLDLSPVRSTPRNSLNFIPYSKFNGDLSRRQEAIVPSSVPNVAQSVRHSQVYASVEGLAENYPAFDAALLVASNALAAEAAASQPPNIPAPYTMVENGYPVFAHVTFAAQPTYHKRTASREEMQALKYERKRESRNEYAPVKKCGITSFMSRPRLTKMC